MFGAGCVRLLFDGGVRESQWSKVELPPSGQNHMEAEELSEPLMQRQLFLEWLTDFHHNEYVSWSEEGNVCACVCWGDWKFDRHLAMILRCGDKERVLWARRRPWVSTFRTHGS